MLSACRSCLGQRLWSSGAWRRLWRLKRGDRGRWPRARHRHSPSTHGRADRPSVLPAATELLTVAAGRLHYGEELLGGGFATIESASRLAWLLNQLHRFKMVVAGGRVDDEHGAANLVGAVAVCRATSDCSSGDCMDVAAPSGNSSATPSGGQAARSALRDPGRRKPAGTHRGRRCG
jgi:hypothetical protein